MREYTGETIVMDPEGIDHVMEPRDSRRDDQVWNLLTNDKSKLNFNLRKSRAQENGGARAHRIFVSYGGTVREFKTVRELHDFIMCSEKLLTGLTNIPREICVRHRKYIIWAEKGISEEEKEAIRVEKE
jgi:hypothetical protein